jgi:hypothetical protein
MVQALCVLQKPFNFTKLLLLGPRQIYFWTAIKVIVPVEATISVYTPYVMRDDF